jgi:hypothetical protein
VGPYLEKPFTKIGLVEWLKEKVLSSSPSIREKKEKRKKRNAGFTYLGNGVLYSQM